MPDRWSRSTSIVDGNARKGYRHRKPMDALEVFIKDHHESYISWAEYERNQALHRRQRRMGDTEELQDVGSWSREETGRRAALRRAQAGFVLERAVFLTVRLRARSLAQRLPGRRAMRSVK
jgi:hypothetical protein